MKNKKKKKQRRLLLLLLLLIGTGVFLGTSTYAWFTANQTVSVNPIDVNVATSSGLQISADGQNWKSILTNTDITGAKGNYTAAVNQIPSLLEPVSTIGEMGSDGKMKMFLGSVSSNEEGNWILSSTQSVETNGSGEMANGKFVAYDIFLSTETAGPVYLTTNSGVTFEDDSDTGIKNATRIAFVTLGHTTSDDTLENIQGLNDGTASPVKIWEPNDDVHTSYGVTNARNTYGIDTLTAGTGNDPVAYDGIKDTFTTDEDITLSTANATSHSDKFQTVTPAIQTIEGFDANQELMTLEAGVTKIRVYMWIEGQDVDCENNASGGHIAFNLQFTTNQE